MKRLVNFCFLMLLSFQIMAQRLDYVDEVLKINNYTVTLYSTSKTLSNSLGPYENAFGISGLTFKQVAPYDPDTESAQNYLTKGDYQQRTSFVLMIEQGEWVSGFSNYRSELQVSLGSRVFRIGDTKSETLSKLDRGFLYVNDNQNLIQIFMNEASLFITFKNDMVYHIYFEHSSY